MHSAFLWLSFAIGLSRGRGTQSQAGAAPLERVYAMVTPAPTQHIARRSAWTRAMGELALVPARPRPRGHRNAPMR